MSVETPAQQASTAAPGMRKIDFSTSAPLRRLSTGLRRMWLLDPPFSNEEILADHMTGLQCVLSMCEAVSNEISDGTEDSKWDHELWLKRTKLKLLDPTVVASAEPPDMHSVVSSWREHFYPIYVHVFIDFWRILVAATISADQRVHVGRFNAAKDEAVSLVVLPAEENKVDKTAFMTDTFLYPVWVNPTAKISFAVQGVEHAWLAEKDVTWTTGLWVQAGRELALTIEMEDMDGDKTGVAAVFVKGHCDESATSD